jgi:ferredoxin--NADP+ reductase
LRRTIAIIGSGPSGCYLAQFLQRQVSDAEITVFERLPVPYGLLRYGVAPDHQGTKAVIEQFDRLFTRGGARFVGNVEVGADIGLQEIRDAFEVVVLATGIASDRSLGIPGEARHGVYGAGTITRLINSHPDEATTKVDLGRRAVIVGNGNVAVDLLRLLIKSEADFLNSDLDDALLESIARPLTEIHIVGRSGAHAAKFDSSLLHELAKIGGVRFSMHGLKDAETETDALGEAKIGDLRMLEQLYDGGPVRVDVHFYFGWVSESIGGETAVDSITFHAAHNDRERLTIEADSVITAVGFSGGGRDRFVRADFVGTETNAQRGLLDAGLYCTGWFGKGASGTIPEHRAESRSVASAIVDDLSALPADVRKKGFAALPSHVLEKSVDFSGWKAVDAVELATAADGRYRRKIRERAEMLAIARDPLSRSIEERVS